MNTWLRGSALGLMIATACGGTKFTPDGASAGGGAGGSAQMAGQGATGGMLPHETEGGAAGVAGTDDHQEAGGEGGSLGGSQGEGGEGGDGAAGAGDPACTPACGADEQCTMTPKGSECRCLNGWVRDWQTCRLPRSCDELHRYAPSLPSDSYALKPEAAQTSFQAYCGMMLEGGGWTLVVNESTSFDPTTKGVADALCYASRCTNIAYSLVLLDADVMLDMSNEPIAATNYTARVIVTGVHAPSRGKTLRTLFTTGPNFVEAENNSNVAVRMRDGAACSTLPTDMAKLVCNSCDTPGCKAPVMVFGDADGDPTCRMGAVPHLAIGAASDYATAWTNCAGWPQDPDYAGSDFYPDYVRVWIR